MSSILNSVINAFGGAGAQGRDDSSPLAKIAKVALSNPQLLSVVAAMFTSANKHGGLEGMIKKFSQAGLGDTAQSWVGEGENRQVSPAQIEQVFGPAGIERIAEKSGVSRAETPDLLSQILPAIVSGISPQGCVQPQSQAPSSADDILSMLGGLLGKR